MQDYMEWKGTKEYIDAKVEQEIEKERTEQVEAVKKLWEEVVQEKMKEEVDTRLEKQKEAMSAWIIIKKLLFRKLYKRLNNKHNNSRDINHLKFIKLTLVIIYYKITI